MRIVTGAVLVALLAACGGGMQVPTERLASADAAARSAKEVGADKSPTAQLYLKMANDGIEAARQAIKDGENERADDLLIRANADAELSLSLAKEAATRASADEALAKIRTMKGGK